MKNYKTMKDIAKKINERTGLEVSSISLHTLLVKLHLLNLEVKNRKSRRTRVYHIDERLADLFEGHFIEENETIHYSEFLAIVIEDFVIYESKKGLEVSNAYSIFLAKAIENALIHADDKMTERIRVEQIKMLLKNPEIKKLYR